MTCDRYREMLELYALGTLESVEANAVAEHLGTGCPACRQALRRALDLNVLVARDVPLVEPPARLRRRIGDSIAPIPAAKSTWFAWALALAALLALAIGLGLQFRLQRAQAEMAQGQSADSARLSSALQILGAAGTKAVSFTDATRPELHGAVYIHRKLGLALIIDRLPTAPSGWKYESWVVPKSGAPRPVEPFHPDSGGRAVSVVPGPVEVTEVTGLAVSMEPENSLPKKPTTLIFEARL